ncbi:hypothetical protein VTO42DRAFT_8691 [Malbranchea cinnamomea]
MPDSASVRADLSDRPALDPVRPSAGKGPRRRHRHTQHAALSDADQQHILSLFRPRHKQQKRSCPVAGVHPVVRHRAERDLERPATAISFLSGTSTCLLPDLLNDPC